MKLPSTTLILTLLGLLVSCGPTYEEQEHFREAERQQAVAESQQALAGFAERHGATPVDLFPIDPDSQRLTARLQEDLEGSVVAFRSGLIDIVRVSASEYELVLASPFFGGTVVTLSTTRQGAAKLMADPPDRFSSFLVVARIDKVAPLTLELEPCTEPDCSSVGLNPNLLGSSHQISGEAIEIELER